MPYINRPDVVNYVCTCGLLRPITRLYFCRHCSKIRCNFCVCHEVDSHFCGKCCENLPSSEARLKRNRCGNCHVCPVCHQDLSTRVGSGRTLTNPNDPKSPVRKMYYLSCLFCRWSTRDVGIPDQTSATGNWPERENAYAARIQDLVEMYKSVVTTTRNPYDREKKKLRSKYLSYTEITGLTAAALRKSIGLPEIVPKSPLSKCGKPKLVDPSQPIGDLLVLADEDIFADVDLTQITTIEQRLHQPDTQPEHVNQLAPLQKSLSVKRSLRCRQCEHNVSKPEYNPNSYKFKIQLFAFYHIPEVRIVTVEPLRAGGQKASELIVKFTNPTQHPTTITILPIDYCYQLEMDNSSGVVEEETKMKINEKLKPEAQSTSGGTVDLQLLGRLVQDKQLLGAATSPAATSLLGLSRGPSMTVQPRACKAETNVSVEIPTASFVLPPRDDAAEYDDSGESHNFQDDPKLVIRRKSNKAFVRLMVTPQADLLLNTALVVGFTLRHIYTNTIGMTGENKVPTKYDHHVKVFLSLGNLVGSD